MKRIIVVVVLVSAATSLMVATSGADVVTHDETDVLALESAGEGAYTQVDDETGEIRIVLTAENPSLNAGGVNDDAVTDIGPVFEIRNVLEERSTATVWIDDGSDAVAFYTPGAGTVEGETEGVVLEPGDSATVGLRVDTRGTDSVSLDGITVKATLDPAVGEGEPPDESGPPAESEPPADPDPPGDSDPPGEPEVLEPEPTSEPDATATEPEATPEPEPTPVTATPEDTGDTAGSGPPEATATPTPTGTPEPTATPAGPLAAETVTDQEPDAGGSEDDGAVVWESGLQPLDASGTAVAVLVIALAVAAVAVTRQIYR